MKNKKFKDLALLNYYLDILDSMSLTKVANEFVSAKPRRIKEFRVFTEDDLMF